MKTTSILKCPFCGFEKEETMPPDSCHFFYECNNCKKVLKPKPGDCCVFCSYGSVKCPPKQNESVTDHLKTSHCWREAAGRAPSQEAG